MKASHFSGALALCAALLTFTTAANAALHSRLGGAAAYDDVLDITWLTDAGLSPSDSWDNQLAWVAGLNSANHLGFNDWRLASMSVAAGLPTGLADAVYDCSTIWPPLCQDNELGYMFYHNLGGTISQDLTGDQTIGDVTLTNIQDIYWSATESGITNSWMYHFDIGFGVWSPKNGNRYAWAVRQGDVLVPDTDGDGIDDSADNCRLDANPDQNDSDGDGFGNWCDADLDNSGFVNFTDLALFRAVFQTNDAHADMDGSGFVNFTDLAMFKARFGQAPGPGSQ